MLSWFIEQDKNWVFIYSMWWIKLVESSLYPTPYRRKSAIESQTQLFHPKVRQFHALPNTQTSNHSDYALSSSMPGSIQVSVLDFKELPSSSNFVKVSLGKAEHEAGDKGTFSFPLTNLRDNLIISIHDSEGNQISHSGIRTMSIIEKGTWDDLFPIEGGGLIHMKLQFILSDEERNRIRSMREAAMKKKEAEILGIKLRKTESAKSLTSLLQRHEVSDVLRDTSSQDFRRSSSNSDAAKASILTPLDDDYEKAAESSDGIKEESFQSFTDATDKKEETLLQKALVKDTERQKLLIEFSKKNEAENSKSLDDPADMLHEQNLEEKVSSDIQETEVNIIKNNEIQLQESVHQQAKVEDTNIHATESKPSNDKKLDKKNLEEKIQKGKPFPYSQETEVNTIKNNEKGLQETEVNILKNNEKRLEETKVNTIKNNEKRLQETSSQDMTSSRSIIAEKIKSVSPKISGEQDNQGTQEKTPRNIRKMISVFESSISQDKAPSKPLSMKSYKVGTLRFLKDHEDKNNDKKLEKLSSGRLRNSFSTGDLRKNLIVTKEEQDGFDKFVEASEANDFKGTKNLPNDEEKFAYMEASTKKLPEACEEDATVSGRMPPDNAKNIEHTEIESVNGEKISKENREYFRHEGDCNIEEKDHQESIYGRKIEGKDHQESIYGRKIEKDHQEKIVDSIPEIIVKGEVHCENDVNVKQGEEIISVLRNSSPKSTDEEASNGSLGQVIKIAIVVGFGVLVFFLRQREPGKGKKKENNRALKTQVFMNKRGSIEEQRRKIGVLKIT